MQKKIVNIKGMHCSSCELLVEDELLKIPEVCSAKVDQSKGTAEVFYEGEVRASDIENAVREAGYSLGIEKKPFLSRNKKDYIELLKSAVILFGLFYIADILGIFQLSGIAGGNYSSLPVVFIIGLTAGISTCMALVGGLVLGASAKFAEKNPRASSFEKFKPHLYFNLGRIVCFFIFGGLIGMLGSFIQLSTTTLGLLTIAVGVVMLTLGMQLVNIFPKISGFTLTMPKFVSRLVGINGKSGQEYSHFNSFMLGGMTFFLPCGFTQAMQIFAVSTGSAWAGAMTMGVFATGTAPGLLGIGGVTSMVKGAAANLFFRTVGLAVILLALYNISNGYNLSGIRLSDLSPIELDLTVLGFDTAGSNTGNPNVTLENGVQVVKMTQDSFGYSPNKFTVKKGVPVRWVITSTDENSCASSVVSSGLNVRRRLRFGENIIEFTPDKSGKIKFSCAMGMYRGEFNVVDDPAQAEAQIPSGLPGQQVPPPAQGDFGGSCGGAGNGCGGGARTAPPSSPPVAAQVQGGVQVIKATYTYDQDIEPNNFNVKAGIPVRLEVYSKEDGAGCMGSLAVPELTDEIVVFEEGKTAILEFIPKKKGDYLLTCAMGVPRGFITVE